MTAYSGDNQVMLHFRFELADNQALSFLQGVKVEGDLTVGDITQGIQK
jgi:hypothetical protein